MTNALVGSSRLYRRLLVFYPEDLRRDFGAEMALVFAEDLSAARREDGWRGFLRVWGCALDEFVRLALPGCLASPVVRVPAVWFAVSSVIMSFEMLLALRHESVVKTPLHGVLVALLLPAMGSPLASLAAMWGCRGDDLTSLGVVPKTLPDDRGSVSTIHFDRNRDREGAVPSQTHPSARPEHESCSKSAI
jgi:hypothetical protein